MFSCGLCVCQAEIFNSSQQAAANAECEKIDAAKPVTSSHSANATHDDVASTSSKSSSGYSSAKVSPPAPRPPLTACPYQVIEICNNCWTRSNSKDVVTKSSKGNHCSKVGHPWLGVSFLILPCRKLLANLPPTIPRNLNFSVCWDLTKHKRCRRGDCTFAHCEEEMAVWKWMVQNNGK